MRGDESGKAPLSDSLAQQLAAQAQQRRLRARPRSARAKHAPLHPPAWTQPATASSTQSSGIQTEDCVCHYLQTQGARILARNLASRYGEIDIVCVDAGVLAFVEVRQRHSDRYGGAAASVGHAKQTRLIRTAQVWLHRLTEWHFHGHTPPCRFDIVAVQGDHVLWVKQAFGLDAV